MVRIWIDDEGILRLRARGRLDPVVITAAHEAFYSDHWDEFVALDRHLADYRGSEFDLLRADHIRELAARNVEIAALRPPLRIAVLIDPGLGFGLARMWEMNADATGWPLAVFTDEAEAWTWLKSDAPRPA